MLDERTAAVLAAVNAATEGKYKVLDAEDLSPAVAEEGRDTLEESLKVLAEEGYIETRYAERGTYCLRSLPKGLAYVPALPEREMAPVRREKGNVLPAFLGALAGAFAGGCLAGVLFLLL